MFPALKYRLTFDAMQEFRPVVRRTVIRGQTVRLRTLPGLGPCANPQTASPRLGHDSRLLLRTWLDKLGLIVLARLNWLGSAELFTRSLVCDMHKNFVPSLRFLVEGRDQDNCLTGSKWKDSVDCTANSAMILYGFANFDSALG